MSNFYDQAPTNLARQTPETLKRINDELADSGRDFNNARTSGNRQTQAKLAIHIHELVLKYASMAGAASEAVDILRELLREEQEVVSRVNAAADAIKTDLLRTTNPGQKAKFLLEASDLTRDAAEFLGVDPVMLTALAQRDACQVELAQLVAIANESVKGWAENYPKGDEREKKETIHVNDCFLALGIAKRAGLDSECAARIANFLGKFADPNSILVARNQVIAAVRDHLKDDVLKIPNKTGRAAKANTHTARIFYGRRNEMSVTDADRQGIKDAVSRATAPDRKRHRPVYDRTLKQLRSAWERRAGLELKAREEAQLQIVKMIAELMFKYVPKSDRRSS